jgi:hypothetical protein
VKPFSYEAVPVGVSVVVLPPPTTWAPDGHGLAQDSHPAGHVTTVCQSVQAAAAAVVAGEPAVVVIVSAAAKAGTISSEIETAMCVRGAIMRLN